MSPVYCEGIWFGKVFWCHHLFLMNFFLLQKLYVQTPWLILQNLSHSGFPFKLMGTQCLRRLYMKLEHIWAASTDALNTEALSGMSFRKDHLCITCEVVGELEIFLLSVYQSMIQTICLMLSPILRLWPKSYT